MFPFCYREREYRVNLYKISRYSNEFLHFEISSHMASI